MSATGWWAEAFLVVRPSPALVHFTGGAPTILSGKRILPSGAALTVTGSAPTVVLTQNRLIQPSPAVLTIIGSRPVQGTTPKPVTATLTVTGGTPTISLTDNKTIQPAAASLTATASAPVVTATANQFIQPAGASLTVVGGQPVVTASDHKLITPSGASLAVTGRTPSVSVGLNIVPSGASLSVSMSAPTVTATTNKFVTPSNAALTLTGGQPVVRAPRLVTPTGASLSVTGGTPTVTVASTGAHYTDNFNRSNSSTLGASWNTDGGFGISLTIASNAAVTDSSGAGGNIYTSAMLTGNNQITAVMKGTPTAGDFVVLQARIDNATDTTGATTGVSLFMTQGSPWTLHRYAADGTGVSSAGSESWSDGDTIIFTCVGATLTVKRNGSTVLTTGGATDIAAGYVAAGLLAASAGIGFDSFDAQDI